MELTQYDPIKLELLDTRNIAIIPHLTRIMFEHNGNFEGKHFEIVNNYRRYDLESMKIKYMIKCTFLPHVHGRETSVQIKKEVSFSNHEESHIRDALDFLRKKMSTDIEYLVERINAECLPLYK